MSSLPDNDATPGLILRLVDNKVPLYSTVISAIVYGFVLTISGKCFKLLLQTKYIYSKRLQKFLFSYTAVMLLMSTASVFCPAIAYDIEATTAGGVFASFTELNNPVFLPIVVWGADGLMIWRCWTLYNAGGLLYMLTPIIFASTLGASPRVKAPSPALGILFSKAFQFLDVRLRVIVLEFTIVLTVFMNVVLALLIVARILYHQRHLRRVFGVEHGSPYTRIITVCVESCFLTAANDILYLALYVPCRLWSSIALGIPILTLPHVCVISPLLIIARVAQGRVATVEQPSESEIQVVSLRFNNVSGVVGETSATASR
ncbi:hypothetical protein GALMADRAFT_282322 [Galerina marginata CBS 339.88]|uniref:Uncharacterized protein n=1 Tax=Galerina marginata (strain CBS 339.88) TaxID=685588 RepID=A0A067SJN6_GALM3|nr:hypothetical protein GALMADRAFT_282322 [Galerina marginata CBS 339.88]